MEEDYIDIVFDGPPGPEAGRFVEVEDSNGKSIKVGEWVQRPVKSGAAYSFWALRIKKSEAERKLVAIAIEKCELALKVQHLVDLFVDPLDPSFTFPDGDTWHVSGSDGLAD